MMAVLADIGGTHARFAFWDGKSLHHAEKLAANLHPTLEEALNDYCRRHGEKPSSSLLIATAAQRETDDTWRFINHNKWVINRKTLTDAGWGVQAIVNDFVGSARGAVTLTTGSGLTTLRKGQPDPESRRVILGPGTGLGLAFMTARASGRWLVQETMGGHMLAACLTDEQFAVTRLVGKLNNRAVSFEDVCSGRGLPILYKAICLTDGIVPIHSEARDLLQNTNDAPVKKTLRLFHEFLGLFAHNAIITGQAYDGVYCDGGIIQRLHANGILDFETIAGFMNVDTVPIVRDRVAATPVWLISDSYVALYGLGAMATELKKNAA